MESDNRIPLILRAATLDVVHQPAGIDRVSLATLFASLMFSGRPHLKWTSSAGPICDLATASTAPRLWWQTQFHALKNKSAVFERSLLTVAGKHVGKLSHCRKRITQLIRRDAVNIPLCDLRTPDTPCCTFMPHRKNSKLSHTRSRAISLFDTQV